MSGFQMIALGVVLLVAYVAILVYLDRRARAVAAGPAVDDVAVGGRGWISAQYLLLIGGHFFLVVGAVKAILGLSAATIALGGG